MHRLLSSTAPEGLEESPNIEVSQTSDENSSSFIERSLTRKFLTNFYRHRKKILGEVEFINTVQSLNR